MTLPHHRHRPGRSLEWVLGLALVLSAAGVIATFAYFVLP